MKLRIAAVLLIASQVEAYNPSTGDFSKELASDVRVLTWNVERNFIADPSRDAAFARVLQAIQPDVIVFQEINFSTATTAVVARMNAVLPNGGTDWSVHRGATDGFITTTIASRWPLSLTRTDTTPASSTRGITLALVGLPDADYPVDLYVAGVHLKCCDSNIPSERESRQRSADALARWFGDARTPGGSITLADGTPMIATGDWNLIPSSATDRTQQTLVAGDIFDESTYGPDIKGDWDDSDLTDLMPLDPYTNDPDTWSAGFTNPFNRFDRFYVTDSVMEVPTKFILNTLNLSSGQLTAAGLRANDTTPDDTSDHLPVVMDVRLAVEVAAVDVWLLF